MSSTVYGFSWKKGGNESWGFFLIFLSFASGVSKMQGTIVTNAVDPYHLAAQVKPRRRWVVGQFARIER
jgi:hypothetical protein